MQERMRRLLHVGTELLPQVEELKHLGEIERRIGELSAVMRTLYRPVVVTERAV